jgi:pimeloyl-ACP methyl ester carboxylesterase
MQFYLRPWPDIMVVAFDQRGYGRSHFPEGPMQLSDFRPLNLIRDAIILAHALGHTHVRCVVGHDFGAGTAALCALARSDLFESVALMSHPLQGSPNLPQHPSNLLTKYHETFKLLTWKLSWRAWRGHGSTTNGTNAPLMPIGRCWSQRKGCATF